MFSQSQGYARSARKLIRKDLFLMMQNMFLKHINTNFPFLKESKILIAISGGLDSVVLTHLCHELKLNISLAHCNFNLRGSESDGDETFVLELAKSLNLEAFTQHFETDTYAEVQKQSIQMAARELRYNWFQELAQQLKFNYILTAHHADDNLETFLINLTRGTGLDGLTGIPEKNSNIVRPLLKFSRAAIESYAQSKNLKWREDSSNTSTKYLRNKIRHDVIPTLKELSPQLLQNFENTINNLNDTADIVEESVEAVLKRAIKIIDDDKIVFYVSEFTKLNNPKAYLFEIFNEYCFSDWSKIEDLLKAQSGKQLLSRTHKLLKDRDTLILTNIFSKTLQKEITINTEDKKVETNNGILFFDEADAVFGKAKNEIFIDAKTLKFPLKVRHWENGDYFYPIGMHGKKKLSKFFKDEKLSLHDKEKSLVLVSNDDIVWVINHRADERFKVTSKTRNILKITLQQ